MRFAAEAGIDSIEHATLLDQKTIRVIKEKNVALVPTFSAHKTGVRIATGTDAGTPFNTHERFALELIYLTEAGLSRTEALAAATSVAADVVGSPKAGRISPGSWADLVFVDGDPLRDLALLQRPKAVWVRGGRLL